MKNFEYAVLKGSLKNLMKFSQVFKMEDKKFLRDEVQKLCKIVEKEIQNEKRSSH